MVFVHYKRCAAASQITIDRPHSYCHTALSEISNRIAVKNITKHHLLPRTIFLPMWGLFTNIVVQFMGQSSVKTK